MIFPIKQQTTAVWKNHFWLEKYTNTNLKLLFRKEKENLQKFKKIQAFHAKKNKFVQSKKKQNNRNKGFISKRKLF